MLESNQDNDKKFNNSTFVNNENEEDDLEDVFDGYSYATV